MFITFNFSLNAGGYIYYEGVVHIPKAITHQKFYYNYYLCPNDLVDWAYKEFFYDQKDNDTSQFRCLTIPASTGKFLLQYIVSCNKISVLIK